VCVGNVEGSCTWPAIAGQRKKKRRKKGGNPKINMKYWQAG